ncbi:MAG TPA: YeeE/YedE thiosulfate transporter family protein, partial [Usitatibacteraceae bacterium]|nr:YeeE/YedE thiosulfate transporter family protein [Usitatibacteraceae bacterium]
MFPLSSTIEMSAGLEHLAAILLGFGFGFALERAGFGSARKLTAVFYFYDMAVVKVMFTAIVTAMAGLFVLSTLGVLDLAELYVEPTSWAGAIVGGLVFGTGFVIGGYCPGTSVAACATGRLDGFAFLGGMLGGVYLFAELFPGVDAWVRGTAIGEVNGLAVYRGTGQ